MDCSVPRSSIHGISQARTLEWVAISFSRGPLWPRDRALISCIGRQMLYPWATREAQIWRELRLREVIKVSASPKRTNDLLRRERGTRIFAHRDEALWRHSEEATTCKPRGEGRQKPARQAPWSRASALTVTRCCLSHPTCGILSSNSHGRADAPKLGPPSSVSAHNPPIQWASNFLAARTSFLEDNFSMDTGMEGWFRDDSSALHVLCTLLGFPGGSDGKQSACNAEDLGSIPGSGRYPGEGNGNPLQYSCLGNPMDGGAW